MATSKYRGHKIKVKDGIWIYSDLNKPVESVKNIRCGYCGSSKTKAGHDGCLGELPNIMNACCGHGNTDEMYIQYLNGVCVQGKEAFLVIKKLKKELKEVA